MGGAKRSLGLVWALLVVAAALGCDRSRHCKMTKVCLLHGQCTADEEGACVVGSDADCRGARDCRTEGKCAVREGQCTAVADADCRGSESCRQSGMCQARDGMCVNLSKRFDPACAETCRSDGRCVSDGGECVALSKYHCYRSTDQVPVANLTLRGSTSAPDE